MNSLLIKWGRVEEYVVENVFEGVNVDRFREYFINMVLPCFFNELFLDVTRTCNDHRLLNLL